MDAIVNSENRDKLHGAKLEVLDSTACSKLLNWVLGSEAGPEEPSRFSHFLAHCDDGVIWGKCDASTSRWLLANSVFSEHVPSLNVERLQQARIFGSDEEILIWRTPTGMHGRGIADDKEASVQDWRAPIKDKIHLLVDRLLESKDGFSLVGDGAGSRQVIPMKFDLPIFQSGEHPTWPDWPFALEVTHYFETLESGAVRVAATRVCGLQ